MSRRLELNRSAVFGARNVPYGIWMFWLKNRTLQRVFRLIVRLSVDYHVQVLRYRDNLSAHFCADPLDQTLKSSLNMAGDGCCCFWGFS